MKPIFILRRIVEKCRATKRSFHLRFVDLEKVYDLCGMQQGDMGLT